MTDGNPVSVLKKGKAFDNLLNSFINIPLHPVLPYHPSSPFQPSGKNIFYPKMKSFVSRLNLKSQLEQAIWPKGVL